MWFALIYPSFIPHPTTWGPMRSQVIIKHCLHLLATFNENSKWFEPRSTSITKNGDANNHIAVHHHLTNHNIDWDSAQCLTYSTNYFQRLTLESWYTNLEQTPLNRCQQLPAPYKRLFHNGNETDKRTSNGPT